MAPELQERPDERPDGLAVAVELDHVAVATLGTRVLSVQDTVVVPSLLPARSVVRDLHCANGSLAGFVTKRE